jgi:hypothetical protein
MKLTEIVSVAGVPGLHKIVGRTKSGLILESLNETQKRFPTGSQDKVSVLEDISMYTLEGEMKLSVVFKTVHSQKSIPDAKEDVKKVRQFLIDTIKLESERVYDSDVKKLINWYHILNNAFDITTIEEEAPETTDEAPAVESTTSDAPLEDKKKTTRKKAEAEEKPKRAPRKKKTEE